MNQLMNRNKQNSVQICIPIVEKDTASIVAHAKKIVEAKADWIEWRIDFFEHIQDIQCVLSTIEQIKEVCHAMPLLVTYRTAQEGGQLDFDQELYTKLYQAMIDQRLVDVLDMEAALPSEIIDPLLVRAQKEKVLTILSYHNFEKTPSKGTLLTLLKMMALRTSDYLKIALMPQTQEDVYTLMEVCHEANELYHSKKMIALSMGELGKISRICGEYFGSSVTFGSLGAQSAPGQIDIYLLKDCLSTFHRIFDQEAANV